MERDIDPDPPPPHGSSDPAVWKLAYEAGIRILDAQDISLGNIRTRSAAVLSVGAAVTTLAAAVGLLNVDPTKGRVLPVGAAWVVMAVMVLLAALSMYVLWPVKAWNYGPDPGAMAVEIDRGRDEADLQRFVTTSMIGGVGSNRRAIKWRVYALEASILLLAAIVVVLVAALI